MIELPDGVTLIAAVGNKGQIGLDNKLPWPHDKKDMKWFRQITMEADFIIGGYFTVVPEKLLLKDRTITVDMRNITPQQFIQLHGLTMDNKIVVIGGAKTYARWMPVARTVLLTKIDYDGPADTFMPAIWEEKIVIPEYEW